MIKQPRREQQFSKCVPLSQKMISLLKSRSRRVRVSVNNDQEGIKENECSNSREIGFGLGSVLTVWRKSLLMSCSGFTVIDGKGNLVYRVDNYCGKLGEIVLMDADGKSLLSVRRQKTISSLVETWVVYEGEDNDDITKISNSKPTKKKKPIWCVKKQMNFLQPMTKQIAQVFPKTNNNPKNNKNPKYIVQGSYSQRSCLILDTSSNDIVAEIKRKEALNGSASFGLEVFSLIVLPGFDPRFAMTLVLLLDQMFS